MLYIYIHTYIYRGNPREHLPLASSTRAFDGWLRCDVGLGFSLGGRRFLFRFPAVAAQEGSPVRSQEPLDSAAVGKDSLGAAVADQECSPTACEDSLD